MPSVKREDLALAAASENFRSFGLFGKLAEVATLAGFIFLVELPQQLLSAVGLKKPKPNVGRLKTVIKNQIYQQNYYGGQSNSVIFKSRKQDGLLMHSAPRITPEFLEDIAKLGAPVKYILVSNEVHDTFADDAKLAFPNALIITPKACKDLVEQAVHVDGTVEEHLETLECDYGFTKMFNYDDNSHCGAERSFVVELFGDCHDKDDPKSNCLFVAQCGYGNFSSFSPSIYLAGFQGLFTRGRYFRMYYYCFTKKHDAVCPYWTHMVKSVDNLKVAVFTHGDAITGNDVREKLLKFYVY